MKIDFNSKEHILKMNGIDTSYYTDDCVKQWLEDENNTGCGKSFTKKDLKKGINLEITNKNFERFWKFLTRKRDNEQWMIRDDEKKNHWFFIQ